MGAHIRCDSRGEQCSSSLPEVTGEAGEAGAVMVVVAMGAVTVDAEARAEAGAPPAVLVVMGADEEEPGVRGG